MALESSYVDRKLKGNTLTRSCFNWVSWCAGLALITLATPSGALAESYDDRSQRRLLQEFAQEDLDVLQESLASGALSSGRTIVERGMIEPKIVNGRPTDDYPSVAAILRASSGTFRIHCSGTLIGSKHVLTAGHCVSGNTSGGSYQVFFQGSGLYEVADVSLHHQFDFPTADLAVLSLKEPVIGVAPVPINTDGRPINGTAVTIMGYGKTAANKENAGIKRVAAAFLSSCRDALKGLTDVLICWQYDPNLITRPGELGSTCNADSGGPAFVGAGSTFRLAGVHSGAQHPENETRPCKVIDVAYDVNVSIYTPWIFAQAGLDLGQPATERPVVDQFGPNYLSEDIFLSSVNTTGRWRMPVSQPTEHVRLSMNATDQASGATNFHMVVRSVNDSGTVTDHCEVNRAEQFADCIIDTRLSGGEIWVDVTRQRGSGRAQVTAMLFPE